jgi:hypothetical protein
MLPGGFQMDITATGPSELTIRGQIQTLEDYMRIKIAVADLGSIHALTLKIPDSLFITSAVIGYLLVLVREKNVQLSLLVGNEKLLKHLDVLQLLSVLQVNKA